MQLFERGDETLTLRKQLLENQRDVLRDRIAEMEEGLKLLDYKIAHYDDLIVEAERNMQQ